MAALKDTSLVGGRNQAVIQTIDQILDMEKKHVKKISTLQAKLAAYEKAPKTRSRSKRHRSPGIEHNEYLCPITGDLMEQPHIAEDGHSYEHSAILKWFRQCAPNYRSPVTNKRIGTLLTPNHALRKLIEDHRAK